MMHGHGNLDRAINLLDRKDQIDFKNFINNSTSINPHNMFICKSKEILKAYYESIFPFNLCIRRRGRLGLNSTINCLKDGKTYDQWL